MSRKKNDFLGPHCRGLRAAFFSRRGVVIAPEAIDADADLECQIDFQAGLIAIALTPAEKLSAWEELKRLHAMRSPARIEQMERARGLR